MLDKFRAHDRAAYYRVHAMLVALALEHQREPHEGQQQRRTHGWLR